MTCSMTQKNNEAILYLVGQGYIMSNQTQRQLEALSEFQHFETHRVIRLFLNEANIKVIKVIFKSPKHIHQTGESFSLQLP